MYLYSNSLFVDVRKWTSDYGQHRRATVEKCVLDWRSIVIFLGMCTVVYNVCVYPWSVISFVVLIVLKLMVVQ
jgi:hypothetical protein